MTVSTADQRALIVAEARTWLKTPWRHRQRCRGAGVDCAQFLVGVFSALGYVPAVDLGYYPADWHLHNDEPRFLDVLAEYADELPEGTIPLPGDVAMFRYGRHAAHGSIVVAWPLIIHAYRNQRMVTISDAVADQSLAARLDSLWRLKALAESPE